MATSGEIAASFGYTLAFFNQNAELKALLARAMGGANGEGAYTEARFVAELQNTKWFRTSSESMRKYEVLKSGDPATFKSQVDAIAARLLNMGGEIGAPLAQNTANRMAIQAMQLGWTDDQMRRMLAGMIYTQNGGDYSGKAGAYQQQFNEMAADYGLTISGPTMRGWVRDAVLGARDPMGVKQSLQRIAASKYVALKDRIMEGETVREIADPYIQSYAKTLEINPEQVGLDDNLIQQALQSKDAKGQPSTQTLYEFEQTLRNDPRWAKTSNAQDLVMGTANKILQTFGLSA